MITKKHFKIIAEKIANEDIEARTYLINFLNPILKELNSNFDLDKFKDYINKKAMSI